MAWFRFSKPIIVLGRPIPFGSLFIRSFISNPKSSFILAFVLFYTAAILYCRTHFFRDPTSQFFDPVRGYSKIYSNVRQAQADALIQSSYDSPIGSSSPANSSTDPILCIGVATVARPEKQYIHGAIGSLLEGLSDDQRKEIHLILFIAHTDPHTNPTYSETWVENLVDTLLTYDGVSEEQLASIRHWEEVRDYMAKGLFDYLYLLEHCYRTQAPYIAIVEDDVLAVNGWYPRIMSAVEDIVRDGDDWLYVRLFYTEILLGWNREEWRTYLGWSLLAFFLLTGTLISMRAFSPRLQKDLSNTALAFVTLVCLPLCIALYFLAGRVSMQPPRTGLHRMDNYGCCSQGLLFPREVAPVVRSRIEHKGTRYVDTLLEETASQENLARWVVVPSLLQHVGAHSSKANAAADKVASEIWNFAFEITYGK